MTDAQGTTSNISEAQKQYWHDFFIENLYDVLALKGLTKRANVPEGQGTVVWWVGIGKVNPVGAALTEGDDPDARSSRASRVSGTLAEYGNLVENSTLLMDTSIDGVKESIMQDLVYDAGKLLDDTILAKALAGGTQTFAGSKVHRSDVVKATTATIDDIRNCVRLLQLSSVPKFPDANGGSYIGLGHPDVIYDLQSDTKWRDLVKYRDTVKWDIKGEVGEIYGVRFAVAPTIPILADSGSASVDIYRTLIMGRDFIGQSDLKDLDIIINEPAKGSEMGNRNAYGYRFVMATEVLSNQKAIRLESSASKGTNT